MNYIIQRLNENKHRMQGKKIAIYPYGGEGRMVNACLQELAMHVEYLVDNYSKEQGVIPFDELPVAEEGLFVILTIKDQGLCREMLGTLFLAGLSAKQILILHCKNILAYKAVEWLINKREYQTVLDVGCGQGLQGRFFEDYGMCVTGLTMSHAKTYAGECLKNVVYEDFMRYESKEPFDVVWASHILEHIPDVDAFMRQIRKNVKVGGCVAITVPSSEKHIIAGHIHEFTAGRVLRYLLCAGFDCRNVQCLVYGYNLSVIIPNVAYIKDVFDIADAQTSQNIYGDQELIFEYLPKEIPILKEWDGVSYFDGDIKELNWEDVLEVLI